MQEVGSNLRVRCIRFVVVFSLSFPFAFSVRAVLQQILPRDLKSEAVEFVREYKNGPISEPLAQILSDENHLDVPTQPHPLLNECAPDFELADDLGLPVRLSSLLGSQPVVLIFYYGYHCSHCVSQLFAVDEDVPLFRELGARIVAVSADESGMTRQRFQEYGRFSFPVLSDPGNNVAAIYGAYRGPTDGTPEILVHATFLIGVDGRVRWANRGPTPFFDNRTLLRLIATDK